MPAGTQKPEAPGPAKIAAELEAYFAAHPEAAVLEDGRVLFDMRRARYAVSESHGRSVLQLWSDELNLVRTVLALESRADRLRVTTRRMGAPRPITLEIVPSNQRRTPTTRDSSRKTYLRTLERVLERNFPGSKVDGMRSAMDLEHSFGPAYVRGRLVKGTAADAVIGVSQAESGAIVDGILTLGVLWLDHCRRHGDGRRHFGGLKVVLPAGSFRTTAQRMQWLNHAAANFQLFTLDERSEELTLVDIRDTGNLDSRLVHAFSPSAALERCRAGLERVLKLLPQGAGDRVELRPRSATEVGLLLYGLEFARVRHGVTGDSFARTDEVTFGAGASETRLTGDTESLCRELTARLFESRRPEGAANDPLFRLQPERWLESRVRANISGLLPGLRADLFYEQVPALSSGDRAMLDLLTLDQNGRLAVLELKANEDLHLPMQALDYWIRVRALNDDRPAGEGGRPLSAFERAGYFSGAEVSPLPPRLLLMAPALRIHPANEPVLRYFSPEIPWELIAMGEHWRRELKVVFRKRSTDPRS